MKRVLFILVVIVLLGAGVYWYFGRVRVEAASFRTAALKRGDLVTTISATGTIEPEELIDIGAQVAGRIITFGKDSNGKSVDYGSPVDEGMLLAHIDRSLYDADLQQANAQMAEAQATVKLTGWPAWMRPTSASFTATHTCIRRRSCAMRNRLGALRLATTVWPMFTRRSMMTPFTGDLMVV